jgi:hypothetical protein
MLQNKFAAFSSALILAAFILLSTLPVLAQEGALPIIGCCLKVGKENPPKTTSQDLTETDCKALTGFASVNWDSTKRALGNECKEKLNTSFLDPGLPITFTPQVTIPGSKYVANQPTTLGDSTRPLADYIIAIFKYAIGIVGIISTIVLMAGGVRWLTAGGNSSAVGEAKTLIVSSLTGLILTIGSFFLLSMVNTSLTELKITPVKRIQYLSVNVGCCKKTDDKGVVTTEDLSEDVCKPGVLKGYANINFMGGNYTAIGNNCEPVTGCCQLSLRVLGTKTRAFNVKGPGECTRGNLKFLIPIAGDLANALTMNLTYMRGYVAEEDLIAPVNCVKPDAQTAQQEQNCINTNSTGCTTNANCCSGLKCTWGGDPPLAANTCQGCIGLWQYNCVSDDDCCDGLSCQNINGDKKCGPRPPTP